MAGTSNSCVKLPANVSMPCLPNTCCQRCSCETRALTPCPQLFNLLLPSYLPGPEDAGVRVAALLRGNREAGVVFCDLLGAALTQDSAEAKKGARSAAFFLALP